MTAESEISTVKQVLGVVEIRDDNGDIITIVEPTIDIFQIVSTEMVGPPGPEGPAGPEGPPGPSGPQGPFAPVYEQRFNNPSTTWTVIHNLDTYPVVTLYDTDENEISGDITKPDRNTVIISFELPFTGIARLKA